MLPALLATVSAAPVFFKAPKFANMRMPWRKTTPAQVPSHHSAQAAHPVQRAHSLPAMGTQAQVSQAQRANSMPNGHVNTPSAKPQDQAPVKKGWTPQQKLMAAGFGTSAALFAGGIAASHGSQPDVSQKSPSSTGTEENAKESTFTTTAAASTSTSTAAAEAAANNPILTE